MSTPSEPNIVEAHTNNAAHRKFLTIATATVGGVGAVVCSSTFHSLLATQRQSPDKRINIARLAPGVLRTESWGLSRRADQQSGGTTTTDMLKSTPSKWDAVMMTDKFVIPDRCAHRTELPTNDRHPPELAAQRLAADEESL